MRWLRVRTEASVTGSELLVGLGTNQMFTQHTQACRIESWIQTTRHHCIFFL